MSSPSFSWTPYATFDVVACPRCRAPIGSPCTRPDGAILPPKPGRGLGETRGAHLARGDRWFRATGGGRRKIEPTEPPAALASVVAHLDAASKPESSGTTGRIRYADIETVPCPHCKVDPGVYCIARRDRRDRGEDHGLHGARTDAWLRVYHREERRRIAAILRAEDIEDRDRAARGLPRNRATLTAEQAAVINAGRK